MSRKPARATRAIDWVVSLAVALVGLLFLAVGIFGVLYGTTPEEDLLEVSGPADDAEISTVRGRYGGETDFLWFTVEGYRVSFGSDQAGYARVLDAVRSREPLTIGISTRRETLFPRAGWVPLYTLQVAGDRILSYEETITRGYRGSRAPFIVGGVLLAVAGFGLWRCVVNRTAEAPRSAQRRRVR